MRQLGRRGNRPGRCLNSPASGLGRAMAGLGRMRNVSAVGRPAAAACVQGGETARATCIAAGGAADAARVQVQGVRAVHATCSTAAAVQVRRVCARRWCAWTTCTTGVGEVWGWCESVEDAHLGGRAVRGGRKTGARHVWGRCGVWCGSFPFPRPHPYKHWAYILRLTCS